MADEFKTMAFEVPVIPTEKAPKDEGPAVLVLVYPPGPSLGRRFTLAGAEHLLGRLPELDISVEVDAVSRQHAKFQRDDNGWLLEDLNSTNGTFVNDERIRSRRLKDGDIVKAGKAILKFLSGSNIEASYHEEIYRMTIVDALTGVHNKRYFLEFLGQEIARSARHNFALSLVMFDVDHFKKVNDTHGHLAGDAVLRELGRRLRPRMRREDLIARYGGEEFACVLSNTPRNGAIPFAEDIRYMIESEPIRHEQTVLPITISLGVAELDVKNPTVDDLIARADSNLYAAKHAGRNRVVG
jgi:diguanylate cyclase (GGDEF)-like protein